MHNITMVNKKTDLFNNASAYSCNVASTRRGGSAVEIHYSQQLSAAKKQRITNLISCKLLLLYVQDWCFCEEQWPFRGVLSADRCELAAYILHVIRRTKGIRGAAGTSPRHPPCYTRRSSSPPSRYHFKQIKTATPRSMCYNLFNSSI